MRDSLFVKTRFDNIATEERPRTPESIQVHNAKLQILGWIYNEGELRPEEELRIQLRNCTEEIMGYELMNVTGVSLDVVKARKRELQLVLEDI